MNPNLHRLEPYPFSKLQKLLSGVTPAADKAPIALSIGEPQHDSPAFVLKAVEDNLHRIANYPSTVGLRELRESIAAWLERRYALPSIDPDSQVLPVNGTREALFAFAQAVVTPGPEALVMSPNPFYQIYEGAALLAGANPHFINCMIFHSLSKRSNLPGLRSGFVAGDAKLLRAFLQYRTYHGCAMPIHHQLASITAWNDEEHVKYNRQQYREKFSAVLAELEGHLPVAAPNAGFYLWPKTPVSDTEFARTLYTEEHVTVLPGRFLAREWNGINPGENRVRMALVATTEHCLDAARRIVRHLDSL